MVELNSAESFAIKAYVASRCLGRVYVSEEADMKARETNFRPREHEQTFGPFDETSACSCVLFWNKPLSKWRRSGWRSGAITATDSLLRLETRPYSKKMYVISLYLSGARLKWDLHVRMPVVGQCKIRTLLPFP